MDVVLSIILVVKLLVSYQGLKVVTGKGNEPNNRHAYAFQDRLYS